VLHIIANARCFDRSSFVRLFVELRCFAAKFPATVEKDRRNFVGCHPDQPWVRIPSLPLIKGPPAKKLKLRLRAFQG